MALTMTQRNLTGLGREHAPQAKPDAGEPATGKTSRTPPNSQIKAVDRGAQLGSVKRAYADGYAAAQAALEAKDAENKQLQRDIDAAKAREDGSSRTHALRLRWPWRSCF